MDDLLDKIDYIIENVEDIDDSSLSYVTISLLREFEDRGYKLDELLSEL